MKKVLEWVAVLLITLLNIALFWLPVVWGLAALFNKNCRNIPEMYRDWRWCVTKGLKFLIWGEWSV